MKEKRNHTLCINSLVFYYYFILNSSHLININLKNLLDNFSFTLLFFAVKIEKLFHFADYFLNLKPRSWQNN